MKNRLIYVVALSCTFGRTYASDNTGGVSAESAFCPPKISKVVCDTYLNAISSAIDSNPENLEEFRGKISSELSNLSGSPEFWNGVLNSPSLSNTISSSPITINFKLIDRENAESVLGIEYSYSRDFNKTIYSDGSSRVSSYQFNFNTVGVITQKAEENPRNFINAKLAFSGSSLPSFDLEKTKNGFDKEECYTEPSRVDDAECVRITSANIRDFFEPVGSSFYLTYGLDAGYEADQKLEAKNQTYGLFVFVAYENFNTKSFMGDNNIKPSIRVAAESVKPNSKTPRAMAGDDTEYSRLSGEFSLVMPLTKLAGLPYSFTYNFRGYSEIDASDIVKDANLDSYILRTISLSTPTGLFISYSSGRLPFGVSNENTVELGFKNYF